MSTWWAPFSTQALTTGSPKNLYCTHKQHFDFALNPFFFLFKTQCQSDAKWRWKPTFHSDVAVNTITTTVSCKSVVAAVWLKAPLFVCLLTTGVHGFGTHIGVWYTYRPNTIQDYHSLFAHGYQWVWLCNISHDDIHLWPELRLTCMGTHRHTHTHIDTVHF